MRKRKKLLGKGKRVLAGALAFILVISGVSLESVITNADEKKIIQNAEFEELSEAGDVLAGWSANALSENNGSVTQVKKGGHRDAYAQIETDATYAMDTASDSLIQVEPGATYEFSYWVKLSDESAVLIPYVYQYGSAGAIAETPYQQLGTCIAEGNIECWTKVEGSVEIPFDTAQIALSFVLGHKAESETTIVAGIDSVNLEKAESATPYTLGLQKQIQADEGNMMPNGDFEDNNVASWTTMKNAEIVGSLVHGGNYAAKLENVENQALIGKRVSGFETATKYKISAWVYVGADVEKLPTIQMELQCFKGTNRIGAFYTTVAKTKGEWKEYTFVFETKNFTHGTKTLDLTEMTEITLSFYTNDMSTFYIDDIAVEKVPVEEEITVMMKGDFEDNDPAFWMNMNNATIVTEPIHQGDYAGKLENAGSQALIRKAISGFETASQYEISAWVYVDAETTPLPTIQMELQCYAGTSRIGAFYSVIPKTAGQWKEYKFVFETEEFTYGIKTLDLTNLTDIQLAFYTDTVGSTFYIDDIVVAKKVVTEEPGGSGGGGGSQEPPQPVGPNLSFETGDFTSWTSAPSGDATVKVTNDKASDGTYSVKMDVPTNFSQGYINMASSMNVESGENYYISYDLFIEDVTETKERDAKCYAYIFEFDKDSKIVKKGIINDSIRKDATGDWESVGFDYQVQDTTTMLRLDLIHNTNAGVSYWDNISITKQKAAAGLDKKYDHGGDEATANENNLIANSTFDGANASRWIVNKDAKVYKTEGNGGVVKMDVTGGVYFQTETYMELQSETIYELTYWVRVEDAKDLSFTAYITGGGIKWKDFTPFDVTDNTDGWKKITNRFVTPALAEGEKFKPLTLGFKGHYDSVATIYLDDVSLVPKGEYKDVGEGRTSEDSVVKNGTFDRFAGNETTVDFWAWNRNWKENGSKAKIQSEVSKSGQAIRIDAEGHFYICANDFSVEPGKIYVLSYWVKVENAKDLKFAAYMNDKNYKGGKFWKDDATTPIYGNTDGWVYVSSAVTIPESVGTNPNNPNNMIQLGLQVYEGSGIIYIDDVSMVVTDIDATNPNLDFELDDKILYNWSLTSYNGGRGTVNTSSEVRPNSNGKVSALIYNEGANGDTHFASQLLKVEPNQTYEFTYWTKQTGTYTARSSMSFLQYKEDQATQALSTTWDGNTSKVIQSAFFSPTWTYMVQGEVEWRQVSMSITVGPETHYIQLRFNQVGKETRTWVDDVVLTPVTSNPNLDFETTSSNTGAPQNWYMSMNGNQNITFKSDSKVYHSGNKSLYVKKDSLTERNLVESPVFFEVSDENIYEFSAWVTARNVSPDCSIRMNLYLYDKNGEHLYQKDGNFSTLYGTVTTLNSGSEIGEWKQMVTRSAPPAEAKYASVSFTITRGSGEIWIDDLFVNVVENETDCIVEYSDFHAIDHTGKIAEWELATVSGEAKFTAGKGGGKLEINSGEVYMVNRTKVLMTDYTYCIKGNYSSNVGGVAEVRFYDYQGNEYTESRAQTILIADGSEFELNFTAPSNTWAALYIGGNQAGTITVKDVTFYMTGKPAGSADWDGYWIWYPENPVSEAVEQYRYFRYEFTLEDDAEYAPFQITVDDKYDLYVNGEHVYENWETTGDTWGNVQSMDLTDKVQKGQNVIAIKAYNRVSEAGVLFDGKFTLKNQTTAIVASSTEVVSSRTANDTSLDWTQVGYNDSGWTGCREYGQPPCSPWGSLFYNSSLYLHNEAEVIKVEVPESVTSGKDLNLTLTLKLKSAIENKFSPMVTIFKRNSLTSVATVPLMLNTFENPMDWPVGEEFEVECSLQIPDYMESGKYQLQMDENMILLTGDDVIDNKFVSFKAVGSSTMRDNIHATIEDYNGTPTLMIDGEPQASFFYMRPDLDAYNNASDAETRLHKSDLELYVTKGGQLYLGGTEPIWLEDGSIDYEAFDAVIYDTLGSNSNAIVMVNIAMFPPKWWLEQNPEHEQLAYNGSEYIEIDDVSFASDKYREEAGEVLRKLLEHMVEQSYYNRVYGLQIGGGQSYEWMVRGSSAAQGTDYSQVSRDGFKEYLKEKYGTVAELRKAWGNSSVTFETAEAPGWKERGSSTNVYMGSVESGELSRNMVDWNLWLQEAATDCFLYYCQIAKEVTEDQIIVGGYNGYLWTHNVAEAQGKSHTAMDRVLDSEYVDYIASPVGYSERQLGDPNTFMSMIDSVQEHGKMYIAEQDNRTCLSSAYAGVSWDAAWDNSIGQTRTMADTIYQEKRDYAHAMVDGNGLWLYDMTGGWLDDDQIYDFVKDAKAEYEFSVYTERDQRNDVAVFVGDETYAYLTANNMMYGVLEPMLVQQRKHLSAMGTGYDLYAMSSLLDGKVSEHKVNIFLSPIEITDEMQRAVDKYVKVNDQYLIWVYLPGISTGTKLSTANMKELTGFEIGVEERKAGLKVKVADVEHPVTKGIAGDVYGNSNWASVSPLTYIADTKGATVLGYNMDGGAAGLAIKDMGDWTSVYSAAPCLEVDFLRNVLEMAGVHIYSQSNEDIIYSNNHYVALHSGEGGEKTITLPENCSVYDVFKEEFVSMDTDKFTYTQDANDTSLFRLMTPNHYAVTARLKSGKGTLSAPGLTEVKMGGSYKLKVKPEAGYELASVTVNGEVVELKNNTFKVDEVNENYVIHVRFNKTPKMVQVSQMIQEIIWLPWPAFFVGVGLIAVLIYTAKKAQAKWRGRKELEEGGR